MSIIDEALTATIAGGSPDYRHVDCTGGAKPAASLLRW